MDIWQASKTSHSKSNLGNFQHQYLPELLVNVGSYRVIVKVCLDVVCVKGGCSQIWSRTHMQFNTCTLYKMHINAFRLQQNWSQLANFPHIYILHVQLSEQKTIDACTQLKFVFVPYSMNTLNNHACSLPPLVTFLLFQSAFANHVNSWLLKWCQSRTLILQWRPEIAITVSTHLSRLCSGVLSHWGYIWTSQPLWTLLFCVIPLLCFSFFHYPIHLHTQSTPTTFLPIP